MRNAASGQDRKYPVETISAPVRVSAAAAIPLATAWSYGRYAVPLVTGLTAAALLTQIYRYERDFITLAFEWKSILLVLAATFFLASGFTLATRRVYASIALACLIFVLLTVISVVKFEYLRASLYTLDFYYYARPTELRFLFAHYPRVFAAGCVTILLAGVLAGLLFWSDETRISRRRALPVFVLALLALLVAYQWRGQRDKIYHFVGWYHVSAAIASAPEAFGVLFQGGFLRAAETGGLIDSRPVAHLQSAGAGGPPPTIVAILHESSFPTGLYPAQCGGTVPEALYTSSNGKRYDLRVETFGGATWLTEYGLMLGISTYYFGDARSFIGYTMENKVRDSLPEQMRKNGYETVALYPSPKTFVNTGRFYTSIGFDRVLDYHDLGATSDLEPDRFYYGKALDVIRTHEASGSSKPLFIFVWTMASHGPYDYTLHPDLPPLPETICGKSKSWAEYIRRLLMSETDLAWFQGELKSRFPGKPFMLAGFGDHQPFIAQDFLNKTSPDPRVPVKNSLAYRTFFRLDGINYQPDWSMVPDSVDTPFFGNVVMLAARQPRHGFYNDRDRLMELCKGRYNDCTHQEEILSFHQRMIKATTIVNR